MAVTDARRTARREPDVLDFPLGASKAVYEGAMALQDQTTGYAENATDAASKTFLGVAKNSVTNTSVAAEKSVGVYRRGVFKFKQKGNITRAAAAKNTKLYLRDNETVGLAGSQTANIYCGNAAGYISSSEIWVDIEPAVSTGADVAV